MRLTEIRVGAARTINLGNFENLRIEASATGTPEEGDTVETVRATLLAEVRAGLTAAYTEFKKKDATHAR